MMNQFRPIYQMPIEFYTNRLKELMDEDARLEGEVRELHNEFLRNKKRSMRTKERNQSNYILDRRMAKRNLRRKAIKVEIEQLQTELKQRIDDPDVSPFHDDLPTPANECVGFCYDICVYVNDAGKLVYRNASPEDADEVGDYCTYPEALRPMDELDITRRTLIYESLLSNIRTPFWVRELYLKMEIQK